MHVCVRACMCVCVCVYVCVHVCVLLHIHFLLCTGRVIAHTDLLLTCTHIKFCSVRLLLPSSSLFPLSSHPPSSPSPSPSLFPLSPHPPSSPSPLTLPLPPLPFASPSGPAQEVLFHSGSSTQGHLCAAVSVGVCQPAHRIAADSLASSVFLSPE